MENVQTVYAIVNRSTGELGWSNTYTKRKNAKLALKHHVIRRRWPEYAVAAISAVPIVISTLDVAGEWTDVN